jgi:hypothetical protein
MRAGGGKAWVDELGRDGRRKGRRDGLTFGRKEKQGGGESDERSTTTGGRGGRFGQGVDSDVETT